MNVGDWVGLPWESFFFSKVPLVMLLFAIIIKIKVIGKPRGGNSTAYWIFNFLEDARGNLRPIMFK